MKTLAAYRRHRRRLILLGGGILLGSLLAVRLPENQAYPLFSWALFTRVPEQVTDYTVHWDGGPVEPLMAGLRPRMAASLYQSIQDSGRRRQWVPGLRERLHAMGARGNLRLVARRFDPLRWWNGEPPQILATVLEGGLP